MEPKLKAAPAICSATSTGSIYLVEQISNAAPVTGGFGKILILSGRKAVTDEFPYP